MATLNPFDLLGDDAEDPSQLAVALPKKVEKAAPVQPAKGAKFPTKPPPPSQAVRESKNGPSGGRGGGAGGRGSVRGRGGGFNRDFRNNDGPANENGFSGGYNRPSGEGDGARRGGYVVGYRSGGRGGGRRGESADGESGDVERPRRHYERRSGTGRGNDLKREGGGRGNWGTTEDDIPPSTEEPTAEGEKSPVVEKQGGGDETTDANKETPADEQEEKEPEKKEMTLEEYEKILEEKKKAMQGAKVEERKVDTKGFESMQQLSDKKSNEEIFIKLGSEKRKDAAEKEEKARKSLSINEFLKPAAGESNLRGGYRGRGGRSGRGQRDGGQRDGGQRDGRVNGGGNQRYGGGPAPAIGDTAQFPTLGK